MFHLLPEYDLILFADNSPFTKQETFETRIMQNVPWTTTTLIFQMAQVSPDLHGNQENILVRTFLMVRPLTYLNGQLQVCAFSNTWHLLQFSIQGERSEKTSRECFYRLIHSQNHQRMNLFHNFLQYTK